MAIASDESSRRPFEFHVLKTGEAISPAHTARSRVSQIFGVETAIRSWTIQSRFGRSPTTPPGLHQATGRFQSCCRASNRRIFAELTARSFPCVSIEGFL